MKLALRVLCLTELLGCLSGFAERLMKLPQTQVPYSAPMLPCYPGRGKTAEMRKPTSQCDVGDGLLPNSVCFSPDRDDAICMLGMKCWQVAAQNINRSDMAQCAGDRNPAVGKGFPLPMTAGHATPGLPAVCCVKLRQVVLRLSPGDTGHVLFCQSGAGQGWLM